MQTRRSIAAVVVSIALIAAVAVITSSQDESGEVARQEYRQMSRMPPQGRLPPARDALEVEHASSLALDNDINTFLRSRPLPTGMLKQQLPQMPMAPRPMMRQARPSPQLLRGQPRTAPQMAPAETLLATSQTENPPFEKVADFDFTVQYENEAGNLVTQQLDDPAANHPTVHDPKLDAEIVQNALTSVTSADGAQHNYVEEAEAAQADGSTVSDSTGTDIDWDKIGSMVDSAGVSDSSAEAEADTDAQDGGAEALPASSGTPTNTGSEYHAATIIGESTESTSTAEAGSGESSSESTEVPEAPTGIDDGIHQGSATGNSPAAAVGATNTGSAPAEDQPIEHGMPFSQDDVVDPAMHTNTGAELQDPVVHTVLGSGDEVAAAAMTETSEPVKTAQAQAQAQAEAQAEPSTSEDAHQAKLEKVQQNAQDKITQLKKATKVKELKYKKAMDLVKQTSQDLDQ